MSSVPSDTILRWVPVVRDNCEPGMVSYVLATIQMESNGNEYAKNPQSGASGLMQILPKIAKDCGIDPFDPIQNVRCGVNLITQIRNLLYKVDPERFQKQGFPGQFERRVIAAGYVRGWSLKAGIAKDMKAYRGTDWDEFLAIYPEWRVTSAYVDRVAILTDGWEDRLKEIYISERDNRIKPDSLEPPVVVKAGLNGKALIGLLLTFFLSLAYILVKGCASWEVVFK